MKLAEYVRGCVVIHQGADAAISEGVCPLCLRTLTPLPVGNPERWIVGDCSCGRWSLCLDIPVVVWFQPPKDQA